MPQSEIGSIINDSKEGKFVKTNKLPIVLQYPLYFCYGNPCKGIMQAQ